MLGRLKRKHGFDAEKLGTRKFVDRMKPDEPARLKTVVRFYTEEKGWVYGKVDPDSDASTDAFAAKVKRPPAPRTNLKVGK